jgi:hypothetical protein
MSRTRAELAGQVSSGVILKVRSSFWAVRWYCRYRISYRDLEQMELNIRSFGLKQARSNGEAIDAGQAGFDNQRFCRNRAICYSLL